MPRPIRNPFMSLWLSAANRMAQSGRGRVAAAMRRQNATASAAASTAIMRFWTGELRGKPRSKR